MIKRFQLVQVAEITAEDGSIYYYTMDGLFIGGWENGKILTAKDDRGPAGASSGDAPSNSSGVVKPPLPQLLKRQKAIQGAKDLASLDERIKSGQQGAEE